jgi:hypothetical protein
MHRTSFVCCGARIAIRWAVPEGFPPGWEDRLPSPRRRTDAPPDAVFTVQREGGLYVVRQGRRHLATVRDLQAALEVLESGVHVAVSRAARGKLFVHAGAVAWKGRAIVIPARTMKGKSTLVAALVRSGAVYYSDEFAVFDRAGRVWPYPKRLSLRRATGWPDRLDPEDLGGVAGRRPVPLGLVLVTNHRRGARWAPRQISRAEAMMVLFDNTVLARVRPRFALRVLERAVAECQGLDGPRGEARRLAPRILATISRAVESVGGR